jgi:hypothetical protein
MEKRIYHIVIIALLLVIAGLVAFMASAQVYPAMLHEVNFFSRSPFLMLFIMCAALVMFFASVSYVIMIKIQSKKGVPDIYSPSNTEFVPLFKVRLRSVINSFNKISLLIYKEQFTSVKEYANKSAYFLSLFLSDWDSDNWNLKKELELLDAYYDSEKVLGININIVKDINNIDVEHVMFIPEVFTTLLQNSISHAFKTDFQNSRVFKVKIRLEKDNLLLIEVSDNGTPSKHEDYIVADKPNKALSLLRQRIEIEFKKLNKIGYDKSRSFEILAVKGLGTTIKFEFPYVEAS